MPLDLIRRGPADRGYRAQAPISLVKALEEYLNDPNFEQNRLEYKQNMGAADIPAAPGSSVPGESVCRVERWWLMGE